ncbi:PREDICTED: uncharacterized protein LOC109114872 [Nelumbo nucifera]|uniref:Uncharacterized protein LOC109114872 n=1 Tax=Nelumbo nucifera TaxID=4432 RepID=A0A1U8Q4N5_NELNU|nr:PREDICTED: uncharacterized protein LOC109114872 [Nelumbo nucifera]
MATESDPSSPYFLHPSDNPRAVLVSSPLTDENYLTWRRAMRNALQVKNNYTFVDGSLPRPEDSEKEQAWVKCNSMVISWILDSLARDLHESIVYIETVQEIWNDLEDRFSQSNAPHIHQLKWDIALLQQAGQLVAAYFMKLKGLWNELAVLSLVPMCTCGTAKEFVVEREQERLHQFLRD